MLGPYDALKALVEGLGALLGRGATLVEGSCRRPWDGGRIKGKENQKKIKGTPRKNKENEGEKGKSKERI